MALKRAKVWALVAGLCLGLGLVTASPFVPVAQAQMRMGMGGGMGLPTAISSADVIQYGKLLKLDETQTATIKDLHEAYAADHAKASKAMSDGFERLRQEFEDSRDPSIFQKESPAIVEKFQSRSEELEKTFLGDMKALLTPEQAGRWTSVERANRRNRSLPVGMLAGESMDIVKLVAAMEMAKTPEGVAQALDRYEAEMDAAIQERDTRRKDIGEQMQNLTRGGGGGGGGGWMNMDFEKLQQLMGDLRKSGIKVRDINERFSTVVQAALPEDERDDFGDRVKREKFPNIYRESHIDRCLKAAGEFSDLSSEAKAQVADMAAKYEREAGPMNDKWARLQADAEKDGGGDDMMQGWMRMARGGDDSNDKSELAEIRKARRKLDSDMMDKLKALLNEDQVDRLPRRESQQFQGFGGGRR